MRYRTLTAVLAALALSWTALAADQPPAQPSQTQQEKQPTVAELQKRIQALEDRVAQLENAQREEPNSPDQNPQWFGDFRHRFGREFDEMMDRMQREFGQSNAPGVPGVPPGVAPQQRPRLGVELAPASDELRKRFNNDVQEGVFAMTIVPGSPAEQAGLRVGDAITSFDGQAVQSPPDLIDAVRAAQGEVELGIVRQGQAMKLKANLANNNPPEPQAQVQSRGGWIRRKDMNQAPEPAATRSTRTEVNAGALQVNDNLAKKLNLTDEQRKKMTDVLTEESRALNEEVAQQTQTDRHRGFSLNIHRNLSRLVDQRVANAETKLKDVLTPEQMKQWQEYRAANNSISISSTIVEQGGGGEPDNSGALGF